MRTDLYTLPTYVWCQVCGDVHESEPNDILRGALACFAGTDDPKGEGYYVTLYVKEPVAGTFTPPKGLKVFSGCLCGRKSWLVMARSQSAAARAFDCTLYAFRRICGETGNIEQIEAAVRAGEGVVLHSDNSFGGEYRIGHPYKKDTWK